MKYVCLSFDDARQDTYKYAFPILKQYGLNATVNVISNFVTEPNKYSFSSAPQAMTKEQILEWQDESFEVACHGSSHKNTDIDVLNNIKELESFGVNVDEIGFASPESWITEKNIGQTGIDRLQKEGKILYIRSGIQILREGFFYTCWSLIEQYTHSSFLYYLLNKKNIIHCPFEKCSILPSAAIKDYTKCKQIKYFINHMKDDEAIILMFHSILPPADSNFGKDHYYWSLEKFERLCKWLSENETIIVLSTKDLFKYNIR